MTYEFIPNIKQNDGMRAFCIFSFTCTPSENALTRKKQS